MAAENILAEPRSKNTLGSHYNIAHLQPPRYLPNKRKPRQHFKCPGHYDKVEGQSLPMTLSQPMSLPSTNLLHLTVSQI